MSKVGKLVRAFYLVDIVQGLLITLRYYFSKKVTIKYPEVVKPVPPRFEAGLTIGLVYAIEGLACLSVNENQPRRAAKLFSWADVMRMQIGDKRPFIEQYSVDRDLAVIHARIDDIEYARLSEEGGSMTVEEAIILALEKIHR